MKEASGELSMTAIAVVAIAAVGVLFTTLIFPNIKGSLKASQYCSSSFDCRCANTGATCSCQYYKEDGKASGDSDRVTCENPNYTPTVK